MALHLQDLGVRCTTPKFAEQALRLEQIRHDTMFQTSSKALPLVSEFAQVVRLPAQQPLPPNARKQAEAVSIHGVDHVAAMCAECMRQSSSRSARPELVAKCWDLASAYKQVILSDSAFDLDSYLVVYNPQSEKP